MQYWDWAISQVVGCWFLTTGTEFNSMWHHATLMVTQATKWGFQRFPCQLSISYCSIFMYHQSTRHATAQTTPYIFKFLVYQLGASSQHLAGCSVKFTCRNNYIININA